MAHTSQILNSKKGVSLTELIAYIVLYGVVMSLLASLVFVIIQSARKVNSQAIINRGAAIMYTDILARTVALNPDTVSKVTYKKGNNSYVGTLPEGVNANEIDTISITFSKMNDYNDDGKKIVLPAASQKHLTFTYEKGQDNIKVYSQEGTADAVESSINLEYNMKISSTSSGNNNDSIYNVITIDEQNDASVYVTFNGYLKFDNKKMEFNFIIPVFATI